MKARWKFVPVVACCAIVLTACNGSSGTQTPSSNGSAVPSTLKIALNVAPTGFDPLNNFEPPVDQIVKLYGGQLMSLKPNGDSGVNQLAESLTESTDRMSWTAKLRSGLKFSNGTPLTAADVVASFNYALKNSGPSGKFVLYDTLSSVVAKGDTTILFNLKKPTTLIPYLLADTASTIWPASSLTKGASFFSHPVSNGQYAIDSFNKVSGRVSLSANPYYWGTKPKIKHIVYTVVPDDGTRLAQAKSGAVDIAEYLDPSLQSQITGSVRPVTTSPFGETYWFIFSDDSPITGNKQVRQAINLAINRKQLIQVAFSGLGEPRDGIAWTQSEYLKSEPPVTQDVAKAKQLLAGTPCKNGCTIKVIQEPQAPYSKMGIVLQQQLKAIGIDMKITTTTVAQEVPQIKKPIWDVYNSLAFLGNPAPITVGLEEVDPKADIFSSYAFPYRSDKMHSLVQQLVTAPESQVGGIIEKINALFAQDLPYISLLSSPFLYASRLPDSVVSVGLGGYFHIA